MGQYAKWLLLSPIDDTLPHARGRVVVLTREAAMETGRPLLSVSANDIAMESRAMAAQHEL